MAPAIRDTGVMGMPLRKTFAATGSIPVSEVDILLNIYILKLRWGKDKPAKNGWMEAILMPSRVLPMYRLRITPRIACLDATYRGAFGIPCQDAKANRMKRTYRNKDRTYPSIQVGLWP